MLHWADTIIGKKDEIEKIENFTAHVSYDHYFMHQKLRHCLRNAVAG